MYQLAITVEQTILKFTSLKLYSFIIYHECKEVLWIWAKLSWFQAHSYVCIQLMGHLGSSWSKMT